MKKIRCVTALLIVLSCVLPVFFSGCGQKENGEETNNIQQEDSDRKQQVSFLFFSDTQADPETGDYSCVGELMAQAKEQAADSGLVIFGGDTVNDGRDAEEWRIFREAAKPLVGLVMLAVPGNHDNQTLLADQFDGIPEAPAGQGQGYFYVYNEGPVYFLMLDSNIMGAANQRDIDWLRDKLESQAARKAIWRVAVMHHPMWTVADNPKDEARADTMRQSFLPLMEEYGVDLILCGHQHIYARSLPMKGAATSHDGRGIVQIMTASGGKGSYAAGIREYITVSSDAPNYLYITADEESLIITAYDGEGKPFDSCPITR